MYTRSEGEMGQPQPGSAGGCMQLVSGAVSGASPGEAAGRGGASSVPWDAHCREASASSRRSSGVVRAMLATEWSTIVVQLGRAAFEEDEHHQKL